MKWKYLLPCVSGLIIFGAATALFLYLPGANIPLLEPAGPIALQERATIIDTILLCSIVVVPVFFLLFYFAWKYREGGTATQVHHRPDWDHDSREAEFFWWLVPTAIIAILSVMAWRGSHALDPYQPLSGSAPLTVEVVALDWKWLFIYPQQGVASVNMLELPVNTPVHFELTADAPMNSFWIPQLGGQIMVMPGMTTQLNLEATRAGSFNGFSANISGDGFAGMAFIAHAVPQSDFDAWVASVRAASSTPLSSSAYEALAVPSEYDPVAYYSVPDTALYNDIVMQYMMPGMSLRQSSALTPTPAVPLAPTPVQNTGFSMPGMDMPMQ